MHTITRISYNSADRQRPTGEARKYEAVGTYNNEHGFGLEDWLFPSEWLIDGWRYAFIQGVDKSHAKLVKAGQPVELTLFTIQPDKEHARMQKKLMMELTAEYPNAIVVRESDFIDISVQTGQELVLFEIKSDLEPKAVIRHALGQILEYAYYSSRTHTLPVRFVIVGRRPPNPEDDAYLKRLSSEFSLPLAYRVVSI